MGEMFVDIEAIKGFMNRKLETFGKESKEIQVTRYMIHRVPREMRVRAGSSTFVPKMVSIGPVHTQNLAKEKYEGFKWRCLHDLIHLCPENALEKIIKKVSSMLRLIRMCYEEQFVKDLSNDTLVQIMVLDGCFIIQILLKYLFFDGVLYRGIPIKRDHLPLLRNDILLLQNQIPFPVLQCLFDFISPSLISEELRNKYGADVLKVIVQCYVIWPMDGHSRPIPGTFNNLLDLFHSSLCPPPSDSERRHSSSALGFLATLSSSLNEEPLQSAGVRRPIRNATELLKAGVKFRNKEEPCFLNVSFKSGIIEIPLLSLQTSSVSRLWNLLAYEKCYPHEGNHITTYMAFMNSLIDTAQDVALLVRSGVLVNKLGNDEEVSLFFNTAGAGKSFLDFESHYLSGLFKDLEDYCATPMHRYIAKLKRDYLSSPWSVISLVAGTLILLLTMLSTFFAVFAYFRPPESN